MAERTAVEPAVTAGGPAERVRAFLRLLEERDIDAWARLWAEDGEQYYPFGTEMFPYHVAGRAAVHERWRALPQVFSTMRFPVRDIWVDGDTAIARFDGECVPAAGGPPYRNTYISVFEFDAEGLIRRYWEYFDPIVAGLGFGLAEVRYPGADS